MAVNQALSDHQMAQLIGGGECFIHVHPKEVLGFSEILELAEAWPERTIDGDTTLTVDDYHVLVDTSAASVTITMPLASKGREFHITKLTPQNALWIIPTPPDTIIGSTVGIVLYNQFSSLHFKAISASRWICI